MNSAAAPAPQRIAEITLDERTVIRRSRAIEDERAAAITDLLKDNQFTPLSGRAGPPERIMQGACPWLEGRHE